MVIKTQKGIALYNWDNVMNIHLGSDGKTIQIEQRNGQGGKLAYYRLDSWAIAALDMLFSAIRDGERAFEFPPESVMETVMVHRSHVKTKATRHGGS